MCSKPTNEGRKGDVCIKDKSGEAGSTAGSSAAATSSLSTIHASPSQHPPQNKHPPDTGKKQSKGRACVGVFARGCGGEVSHTCQAQASVQCLRFSGGGEGLRVPHETPAEVWGCMRCSCCYSPMTRRSWGATFLLAPVPTP